MSSTTLQQMPKPADNDEEKNLIPPRNTLNFTDINFVLPSSAQSKNPFVYSTSLSSSSGKLILNKVCCEISSGEVLAILGPSGAGKTTLLNALTGSLLPSPNPQPTGYVMLNGNIMTGGLFKKHCVSVPQYDNHLNAFLTPRETLTYAARLHSSRNHTMEEINESVELILVKTGLIACAETYVGNDLKPGISGGQKRRLSLGTAIVKKPRCLFLDEPTSGLDAASAAGIMTFISDLAKSDNLIIVSTIHQPSTKVFAGFDKVMLLTEGSVAYCGESTGSKVLDYFSSIGYDCIDGGGSPAEYMLDLVNKEFADSTGQVQSIIDKWDVYDEIQQEAEEGKNLGLLGVGRHKSRILQGSVVLDEDEAKDAESPATVIGEIIRETGILIQRQALLISRDPTIYIGRAIVFAMAILFFCIVYIKTRDRTQDQVFSKVFLLMWVVGVPASLGVVEVFGHNSEIAGIVKEVKNGGFSIYSFLLSNFLLQIPSLVVLSACALFPAFLVVNFTPQNAHAMLMIYFCNMLAFESIAQVFAVTFENALFGMLSFMSIWFAAFLFSGLMIPKADVIWPFRTLSYCLPLEYTLRSMAFLEFDDSSSSRDFKGAEFCESAGMESCTYHFESNGDVILPGWTCGATRSSLTCYGRSGSQILDSVSKNFKAFTSDDNVLLDASILLCIAMAAKLIYFYLVVTWCKNVSVVVSEKG